MTARVNRESPILHAVRAGVMSTGLVSLWRNNTGEHHVRGADNRLRVIKYGLGKGSPDLVGNLHGSGRLFCLEVKAENGTTSEDQHRWHAAVRSVGGFVAVVRGVDEAISALHRARRGMAHTDGEGNVVITWECSE